MSTKHEDRKSFLANTKTPQKRIEFLNKHTHDMTFALVSLRAELYPDGWKSTEDDARSARSQKAAVLRHLRTFSNAAKELDKLHIWALADIPRIVGVGGVVTLADVCAHQPDDEVDDGKLRECVDFLLQVAGQKRLAMVGICQEVLPIGWVGNGNYTYAILPIQLLEGDAIPRYAALLLGIDEDGSPHASIASEDDTHSFRHCTPSSLGTSQPEFVTTKRTRAVDMDVFLRRLDNPVSGVDASLVQYNLAFKEMGDGFYGIRINFPNRAGNLRILGCGLFHLTIHNLEKADGTPDNRLAQSLVSDVYIRGIAEQQQGKVLSEVKEAGNIEVRGRGHILFIHNNEGRAFMTNITKEDGSEDSEFAVATLDTELNGRDWSDLGKIQIQWFNPQGGGDEGQNIVSDYTWKPEATDGDDRHNTQP